MRTKQILLCMLLACFTLSSFAQNRWGVMAGGLLSKSTAEGAYFRGGGYVGGLYDVKVTDAFYIQPQLLFTYEEFRTNSPKYVESTGRDFYSKFNVDLPLLASFNVRVNQKVNLRINAGPYVSMALFGRERSWTYVGNDPELRRGLDTWSMNVGDRLTYGLKGGISIEMKHFFINFDCKYSLDKHVLYQDAHGLTLSAGVGYKF